MIGTIRKHSKWLWWIVVALTVISFVIWGGARGNGPVGGPENAGSISGHPISKEEYIAAQREVLLDYFFKSNGRWPDREATRMGFDVEQQTYYRLLLIQKLDEFNIEVSTETAAEVANNILRNVGNGQPVTLEQFVQQALKGNATADDFARFIRHDIGIQQLISLVGGSGKLVTPQEARAFYERENKELSAQAVFFSGSNYLASVSVTNEAALAQFFTNHLAEYRIPERVQVSYAKFDLTNFFVAAEQELAKVTNLTQQIEMVYQRSGTNVYRDAKSPEEAKQKIREDMLRETAIRLAARKASDFARPVLDKETVRIEDLEKEAKQQNVPFGVTTPFPRQLPPAELDAKDSFANAAFALTPENPVSQPFLSGEAVYVIGFVKRVPSEAPAFETVRARVTDDYKWNQAVSQARGAGFAFAATLTNALAQGKTFAGVCVEANLQPLLLPPFSMSTRSLTNIEEHLPLSQLQGVAFSTPPGTASGLIPTREGGMILYVQSELPLDEARVRAELPAFVQRLRQARQNEAFNDWFGKEAPKALREIPRFQTASRTGAGASK